MGCPERTYYNSGANCTIDLVKQVAEQLATRTVRDTEMPDAQELSGNELIAIVQDGENRKVSISSIMTSLGVRYGTTEYWNSQVGYKPPIGTIVIYSDYKTITVDGVEKQVPGIKVGTGNGYVQDLAFTEDAEAQALFEHINDTDIHITPNDRDFWNNKLNVTDYHEVVDEALIFHRH